MGKIQSRTIISALALAAAAPAIATQAAPSERIAFDLPAEPLSQSLKAVADRAGRSLIAPEELLRGRVAPPLSGSFTAKEAIQRLLEGSGLQHRLDGGTLVIEQAPTSPRTPSMKGDTAEKIITVTGTRIRGAGSASPMIVTTRSSLEEQGVTDLAAFTRVLPQNYAGGQNPGVAGGGQQGGQSNVNNSAALNLRGLGPDATLTLLNGHRLAYDALSQGIDISAIPLAAIERVEVIADGSSALYGSDAVGGVANIVLRRDYDGLETSARLGASTEGGNFQQQYSAVGGHRWSSGGAMIAIDASRATPIYASQRDYTGAVDPSLTLTLRNSQLSGVVAAHQRLGPGATLEIDASFMDRRSRKQTPFFPDQDVLANGLVNRPQVRSFSLAPTARFDLGSWLLSASATYAASRTRLETSRYFNSEPLDSRLTYENSLSGVELTAEGPLFALPAGEARLAVGGGLRRVVLDYDIVDLIDGTPVPFRSFIERRHVQFAYGELSLPLVSPDNQFPFINQLQLSGAIRYERWKGIDAVATPRLGLVYRPLPDLTLSGTWGKSFKAPTLFQVNQPLQGSLLPGFIFSPAPQPAGSTVLLLGGGNPGLRSERATTWSATVNFRPRSIEGLSLQASYFHIDYQDRIGSPLSGTLTALGNPLFSDLVTFNPTAAEVEALIANFPQGLVNQTGQPFDPGNVGAIIDSALRNTSRQRIRGVDLEAGYRYAWNDHNRLVVRAAANYLRSDQQLAPAQPIVPLAGTIFNPPHWRSRIGVTWENPIGALSAFANYVGPTHDTRFPTRDRVGSFKTLDLSGSLMIRQSSGPLNNIELRLSALNLLNEKPDVIRNAQPEAPPYDSTNHSPVGRFLSISIRKHW